MLDRRRAGPRPRRPRAAPRIPCPSFRRPLVAATARRAPRAPRGRTFRGELKRLLRAAPIEQPRTRATARRSTRRSAPHAGSSGARRSSSQAVINQPARRRRARSADGGAAAALFTTLERNREWWTTAVCSATVSASSSPTANWCGSTTRARGSSCRCSARSARRTACGPPARTQAARAARRDGARSPPGAAARSHGSTIRLRRRRTAVDERDGAGDRHPGARARGAAARRTGLPRSGARGAEAVLARATGRRAGRDARRRALPAVLVRADSDRRQRLRADARGAARLCRDHRQRRRRDACSPPAIGRRASTCGPADTGAWSLYQLGGAESDLSYHELLTGFLRNLCDRTATAVYCATATRSPGAAGAAGDRAVDETTRARRARSCASGSRRSRASA